MCFRDLSNKSRDDLMNSLQEIRNILSEIVLVLVLIKNILYSRHVISIVFCNLMLEISRIVSYHKRWQFRQKEEGNPLKWFTNLQKYMWSGIIIRQKFKGLLLQSEEFYPIWTMQIALASEYVAFNTNPPSQLKAWRGNLQKNGAVSLRRQHETLCNGNYK